MARTSPFRLPLPSLLFACGIASLNACSVSVPGLDEATYRCASDDDCLTSAGYRCGPQGTCVVPGAAAPDGGRPVDEDDAGVDGGRLDAGADAGRRDAGPHDAGEPDAGAIDAGLPDAGRADAGPVDAGPGDGGPLDAGEDLCGNGIQEPGEACDDGDADNHDGCTTACELARCGDGLIQVGEACDDGNTASGDGCGTDCSVEDDRRCFGEPSVCTEPDRVVTLEPGGDLEDDLDEIDDGDVVFLQAGLYPLREDLDFDVTIIGEPGAIIEGDGDGPALKIRGGARVHIQGVTLRHPGTKNGDHPIRLEGGSELTLLDVHVGPSGSVGIYADDNNNNQLTVLRSRIEGNAHGGIRSGKRYRIVGNVMVSNGDTSSDLGGVQLVTANGTLAFNTIANNTAKPDQPAGVRCDEADTPVQASILWQNGGAGNNNDQCMLVDTSAGTDPLFVPGDSYRLSPASPLIDFLESTTVEVPRDLDGDARPLGAGYDLGADEVP